MLAKMARGYAMGTIFTVHNPQAAAEMFYEVNPEALPTGLRREDVIISDTAILKERARIWELEDGQRWGQGQPAVYQKYMDWLLKWKILKVAVTGPDIVNNNLLDKINSFDQAAVVMAANKK